MLIWRWIRVGLAVSILTLCSVAFLWQSRDTALPAATDARAQKGLPLTDITLPSGQTIRAEVASLQREKMIGMMFRDIVPKNTGMLFVHSREGEQQIWMKNTLVALDLIWIDQHRVVTAVSRNVPACRGNVPDTDIPTRSGRAQYILEIAAGEALRLGIIPGMVLHFKLP